MPSDWTPIRCTGRQYPNAPFQARMGCLERAPAYWWVYFSPAYDMFWPAANTAMGIRWTQINSATGKNPQNQWTYSFAPFGGSQGSLRVFTEFRNPPKSFWLIFRIFIIGGPFARAGTWGLEFPDGFPKWQNSYTLPLIQDGGGWGPGGAPSAQSIFNAHYTQLAPNVCLSGP